MNARRSPVSSVHPVRLRRIGGLAFGLLIAGLLLAGIAEDRHLLPPGPPLTRRVVRIRGREITVAQVKAALQSDWKSGWIDFPIRRAVDRLERMPWVAHAAIRRIWPDTLVVTVREQRPIARWHEEALVNAQGRLFYRGPIPRRFRALPELSGAAGSLVTLVKMERTCARRLARSGEGLHSLIQNRRGGFRLRLADGLELRLGRKAGRALRRLDRFLAVVRPALGPRLSRAAYVDLRYINGFAVGWRHPPLSATN
jgi:cell division protein FtsQ